MNKNIIKLMIIIIVTVALLTGCKIQTVEEFNKEQLVEIDKDKEGSDLLKEDLAKEDKGEDKEEVNSEVEVENKEDNKTQEDAVKDKDIKVSKEEKLDSNKKDTNKAETDKADKDKKKPVSNDKVNNIEAKPETKPVEKPKPVENNKPSEKPKPTKQYVTIEIRVDTILKNYDKLDPKLQSEKFVPSSGVILPKTTVELVEGETVFDILLKATRQNRIHMEYEGGSNNQYGSAYIKGINNIYEFSCGDLSGWVYKVNGVKPNHGVSAHKLKGGEVISFNYTCDQGRDI